jgi:hypothetical protein
VKRTIPIGASLVHPTVAEPVIRLVSGIHGTSLRILGEHLEDLGRVDGKVEMIRSETAYFLPDHSLLLFGYQREDSTDTASIARLSADLKEKRTFLFQPLWVSNNVSNALPTGTSAEFVTVRHVRTIKRWPDEKRVGLILAFIHVK